MQFSPVKLGLSIGTGLLVLLMLFMSLYTVPEGSVGIVKRWGKVVEQVDPGFHAKIPFADSIREIEVRQRASAEDLTGATENQLPFTATVSVNWTVDKASAMQLYIDYGGLDQFETRILDRELRSTAKGALAKFAADKLIRNRNEAVSLMHSMMVEAMGEFPLTINSVQLENIILPETYLQAILSKEEAREAAEKEKHNLVKQDLEAQQIVQTADAKRDATKSAADGEAYRLVEVAKAEAEAIRLVNNELSQAENFIKLRHIKQWDGKYPQTMLADSSKILMSIR